MWITRPSRGKQVSRSFCPQRMRLYKVVKNIRCGIYNKVCRPYGKKDVTINHDRITLDVQRDSWFNIDIRTDVNQQRDLLDTTNVNQLREILSDVSTDFMRIIQ